MAIPWFLEPLYLGAPSAIAIYFFVYYGFDKYLWNWAIFQKIGLVKTPDLNGEWVGEITSSHDDYRQTHGVKVNIVQQWSTISIVLKTKSSTSHSFIAGVLINEPRGITLHYNYLNEPVSDASKTMHAHRGTTWLIFNNATGSLDGEYYSGRDRKTNGKLKLVREK